MPCVEVKKRTSGRPFSPSTLLKWGVLYFYHMEVIVQALRLQRESPNSTSHLSKRMLGLQTLATACDVLNVSSGRGTWITRLPWHTLRPTEPSCVAVFYIFQIGSRVVQASLELAMRLALIDKQASQFPCLPLRGRWVAGEGVSLHTDRGAPLVF